FASLALGMFGEHEIARGLEPHIHLPETFRWLTVHGVAAVSAVGALTFVHIVAGEMVPKSLALQHAHGVARIVYWPMRVALALTYPFVIALRAIGGAVLAMFGVRRHENTGEQFHTADELRLIVEESARGGAIRGESGRLLRELFEFGDLTAGQVM